MVVYEDLDLSGDRLFNKQSVLNYIENLLSIRIGEVPFKRNFGSYLEDYLFEPYSFLTTKKIELEIERVISIWLPMIKIENIEVEFDPDSLKYKIQLNISIDKINEVIEYNIIKNIKA